MEWKGKREKRLQILRTEPRSLANERKTGPISLMTKSHEPKIFHIENLECDTIGGTKYTQFMQKSVDAAATTTLYHSTRFFFWFNTNG